MFGPEGVSDVEEEGEEGEGNTPYVELGSECQ